MRRVRQHHKTGWIWHQANLANCTHPLNRLELIEAIHRHHRYRQADPIGQPPTQAGKSAGLATDDRAIVAIQELHKPDTSLVRSLHNRFVWHLYLALLTISQQATAMPVQLQQQIVEIWL
jgi:hypothetical protein